MHETLQEPKEFLLIEAHHGSGAKVDEGVRIVGLPRDLLIHQRKSLGIDTWLPRTLPFLMRDHHVLYYFG